MRRQAVRSGEREAAGLEHLPYRVDHRAQAFERMSAKERQTVRAGEEYQRECRPVTMADLDPCCRLLPPSTLGEDHRNLPLRGDAEPVEQGSGEL